jgi:hypothetical protein
MIGRLCSSNEHGNFPLVGQLEKHHSSRFQLMPANDPRLPVICSQDIRDFFMQKYHTARVVPTTEIWIFKGLPWNMAHHIMIILLFQLPVTIIMAIIEDNVFRPKRCPFAWPIPKKDRINTKQNDNLYEQTVKPMVNAHGSINLLITL